MKQKINWGSLAGDAAAVFIIIMACVGFLSLAVSAANYIHRSKPNEDLFYRSSIDDTVVQVVRTCRKYRRPGYTQLNTGEIVEPSQGKYCVETVEPYNETIVHKTGEKFVYNEINGEVVYDAYNPVKCPGLYFKNNKLVQE